MPMKWDHSKTRQRNSHVVRMNAVKNAWILLSFSTKLHITCLIEHKNTFTFYLEDGRLQAGKETRIWFLWLVPLLRVKTTPCFSFYLKLLYIKSQVALKINLLTNVKVIFKLVITVFAKMDGSYSIVSIQSQSDCQSCAADRMCHSQGVTVLYIKETQVWFGNTAI